MRLPDPSPETPDSPAARHASGYVPGGWDMFHIGHLNLLRHARPFVDRLIVGVVTDEALFDAKGKFPVVPLDERLAIVQSIGIVDEVVIDHSSHKIEVWNRVHFNVIFKGTDWQGTPKGDRLERDMASIGVEVHYLPYTPATSSSHLRRVIAERRGHLQ